MSPGLGNRLKVLRAERNWTQAELAERASVTRKTINTIERGVFVPSTVLALRLARVFGVPVEAIFHLDESATDPPRS
ncbi:helix-turn-helix transcriptional regulator [Oleiagrimonas sp. C23AA]|uniref:helix-turn-helix transcriptional regulator n=1 Tax=Oleiagrimonas sp. C23AA TaxID=2719047 RepID=UPI001420C427|nr:helix-turn-helix transcriptional regulator [Oleiagrimonas sp. C23AA]NII12099.1 helix-turn-helix transcriptional regulator [Oleiagrimonas sp. C23AA]